MVEATHVGRKVDDGWVDGVVVAEAWQALE